MQLFYNNLISPGDEHFTFNREESKHIVKVLRKKNGDNVFITNGLGHLFKSEVIDASDKKCTVAITDIKEHRPHRNYWLHVAIAPTKNNDRIEWFVEKAAEIGIDEITPIICANSERNKVNTERLDKKIVAALKQSLQYHKPVLNPPLKFREFIEQPRTSKKFIAHCENSEKKSLPKTVSIDDRFLILIGPEGDFTPEEIQDAVKKGFVPVSLGRNRLRTETAALAAVQWFAFMDM